MGYKVVRELTQSYIAPDGTVTYESGYQFGPNAELPDPAMIHISRLVVVETPDEPAAEPPAEPAPKPAASEPDTKASEEPAHRAAGSQQRSARGKST